MNIVAVIVLIIIWNFIGFFILGFTARIGYCIEVERLNPLYIYKDRRVNWFGALCLALVFNVTSPVVTICFWFYKLCTVGRRHDDDD